MGSSGSAIGGRGDIGCPSLILSSGPLFINFKPRWERATTMGVRGWSAYRAEVRGPLARGLERLERELRGSVEAVKPLDPASLTRGNLGVLADDLDRLARMARNLADLARRGAA